MPNDPLGQNTCQYLAWESVVADKESLNLDVFQSNQATTKRNQSNEIVDQLLKETYQWLLVPTDGTTCLGSILLFFESRAGQDSPILRASRKAVHEEHLITTYAASRVPASVVRTVTENCRTLKFISCEFEED